MSLAWRFFSSYEIAAVGIPLALFVWAAAKCGFAATRQSNATRVPNVDLSIIMTSLRCEAVTLSGAKVQQRY